MESHRGLSTTESHRHIAVSRSRGEKGEAMNRFNPVTLPPASHTYIYMNVDMEGHKKKKHMPPIHFDVRLQML